MLASTSGCKKARGRERKRGGRHIPIPVSYGRMEGGCFSLLTAAYWEIYKGGKESQTMQKWGKWRKESNDFALFGVFGSEIKKEGKKDPCLPERTTGGLEFRKCRLKIRWAEWQDGAKCWDINSRSDRYVFLSFFLRSFPERSLQLLVLSSFSFGAMSHFGEMSQTSFR